ncbi:hypothetical protein ACHOLT_17555 [Desulfitobacterium sp. Sab5]|uniref:hypothetical protein n=1 Tax=Desulfitobacterium nosdiversum TaxID=3375356 RepID=UPI003CE93203
MISRKKKGLNEMITRFMRDGLSAICCGFGAEKAISYKIIMKSIRMANWNFVFEYKSLFVIINIQAN